MQQPPAEVGPTRLSAPEILVVKRYELRGREGLGVRLESCSCGFLYYFAHRSLSRDSSSVTMGVLGLFVATLVGTARA